VLEKQHLKAGAVNHQMLFFQHLVGIDEIPQPSHGAGEGTQASISAGAT
jgi:hypothetical protein